MAERGDRLFGQVNDRGFQSTLFKEAVLVYDLPDQIIISVVFPVLTLPPSSVMAPFATYPGTIHSIPASSAIAISAPVLNFRIRFGSTSSLSWDKGSQFPPSGSARRLRSHPAPVRELSPPHRRAGGAVLNSNDPNVMQNARKSRHSVEKATDIPDPSRVLEFAGIVELHPWNARRWVFIRRDSASSRGNRGDEERRSRLLQDC